MVRKNLKLKAGALEYSYFKYGELELGILSKNARNLSHFIELTHLKSILSHRTEFIGIFVVLIKFHSTYNINSFPDLKKMVVDYFKKYPDTLREIHYSGNEVQLTKMMHDLGFLY